MDEFLKAKKNIQNSYLSERLDDIDIHQEMSKLFKPIAEAQRDVKLSCLGELRHIKEKLPTIAFPQLQAIAAPPEESENLDTSGLFIGPVAEQYLRQFSSQQDVDKTFCIYDEDRKFYIGDSPVEIDGDNITVKGTEYTGTPGLWELLIMKEPDRNIYTDNDRAEYAKILKQTSAMKHGNNPASNKPKSSKGYKYKVIIKPIWQDFYGTVGRGLETVVIPSSPDVLVDRLQLLLASKAAGITGVRNERVNICDELLRQNIMTKSLYKKYISHI